MKGASVELRDICMRFGDMTAVERTNLSVDAGQFVVLLGPSGSGKTTLLNMLGGFLFPSEGSIWIDGRDITGLPPAKRPTTTVFQDYALFPHLNVDGNVGFGLAIAGCPKQERASRIARALDMVGLGGFGKRRIHELSGGQKQRIALARALVLEPSVLLLDEPLGALDLNLRKQMQDELKHLQKSIGTTFVHVTHDQEEALNIADTIIVLNQGRVEDIGPPSRVYLRPATKFVANFMGDGNTLDGSVESAQDGELVVETGVGSLRVKGAARNGEDVRLFIRPEMFRTTQEPDSTLLGSGSVDEVSFAGSHLRAFVQVDGQRPTRLQVKLPCTDPVNPGDHLDLYVRRSDITVLKHQ